MTKEFSFAKRTGWSLSANELMSSVEKIRAKDLDILDLTESNPTKCHFDYPQERILKALSDPQNMDYRPSAQGLLKARQAICRRYWDRNYRVESEQIFLTSSTSEAYSFLFRLLADPNDRVVFPRPSYPLFEFLVNLNDIEMDTYPLVYQKDQASGTHGWHIDMERFRSAFYPNTKAVVLVNPNNPTGSYISRNELAGIAELCRDRNVSIISDEVFWDYQLNGSSHEFISAVENQQCLTFVLGGISKCLALPQMKISWIIINGPDKLVQEARGRLEIIADTYLSVNTPVQNALEDWLTFQPIIREQVVKRIKSNYDFLGQQLKSVSGCEYLKTQGGWYGILRLPDFRSEEQWAIEFLAKKHVFIHPGYFFDFDKEPYIVLSLLTPEPTFQEGVKRILEYVSEKKGP